MLPLAFSQLILAGSAFTAAITSFQVQEELTLLDVAEGIFPHPLHRTPSPDKTIYEILTSDDRFSNITKAINFVGEDVISLLNDSSRPVTFFAVPDKALQRPHRKHCHKHRHHKHRHDDDVPDMPLSSSTTSETDMSSLLIGGSIDVFGAMSLVEEFEKSEPLFDDPEDDPDRERRKKIIQHIVRAILNYHVLPGKGQDLLSLGRNTTYPTNLKIHSLIGGHAQRIKVHQEFLKPDTEINLYSKIIVPDIHATNGIMHVVNHPLLPPLPIFQELFLAHHFFSTFTSALQRTGLTNELDLRYVKTGADGHGHLEGTTAVTTFAPSNIAFRRLPPKLQWFLFSPFGTRALRKILEYHIVPGVVAHADFLYNKTAEAQPDSTPVWQNKPCAYSRATSGSSGSLFGVPRLPHKEPISSLNITLDTRFDNHTVNWSVEKFKITLPLPGPHKRERVETVVLVNEHPIHVPDVVGMNGAIHVVHKLLCPCHHRKGDSGHTESAVDPWSDWEDWLPKWAAED